MRIVGLVLVLAALGCGSREARPAAQPAAGTTSGGVMVAAGDACRGHDLVLEDAMEHCRVDVESPPPPAETDLVTAVEPATIRSGETQRVWLSFRNVTAQPIDVFFPHWIGLVDTMWRGEERVDERVDPEGTVLGALVGCTDDCRSIHVMLEPGGTLRAYVDVAARVTILREPPHAEGETVALDEVDGGPIAPGTYDLVISLPWADPHPELGGTRIAREVRTAVTVTP